MRPGIRTVVVLAIVGSLAAACSASAVTPTPAPTPTPTATSASTVAPTPTPEVTPQITTGTLTGELLSDGANAPVSGAGVILCRKSTSGCTTDASLQAISDSSGEFEIGGIPEGSYVVLYSPKGAPGSSAIGLAIDLDDQSASCAYQTFTGSAPASCKGSVPFADDKGLFTISDISLGNSGMVPTIRTLSSPKYGLWLNFEDGAPLSVEITAGNSANVRITVRQTS